MFKAFRIRPVVESMDENGEVTCEAFATLAAAERDCAQFEARRSVSGREGKTIIWTLYGVNPEESGVRTECAIADRDTEVSARELLTSLIGPFTTDGGRVFHSCHPAGRRRRAPHLCPRSHPDLQRHRRGDCIALAEDSIAAALNTLMPGPVRPRPTAHRGRHAGRRGAPADPKPYKVRMKWGSGMGGDEKPVSDYEFASIEELNAFCTAATKPTAGLTWSRSTRIRMVRSPYQTPTKTTNKPVRQASGLWDHPVPSRIHTHSRRLPRMASGADGTSRGGSLSQT